MKENQQIFDFDCENRLLVDSIRFEMKAKIYWIDYTVKGAGDLTTFKWNREKTESKTKEFSTPHSLLSIILCDFRQLILTKHRTQTILFVCANEWSI